MAYLTTFWETLTEPGHPVLARLTQFAAFYAALKRSGVVLRESGKKSRMVFGLQLTETAPNEQPDDREENFQYIPGLCRVLERLYFTKKEEPTYVKPYPGALKFQHAAKKRPRSDSSGTLATHKSSQIIGAQIDGKDTNTCLSRKKVHGSIVHRQIQDLVERFIKSLRERKEEAYFIRETEHQDNYWDPCTLQFIRYLTDNGLMPLASECIVFDPMCQIATSIDLVVLDTMNLEVVFIEIKSSTSNKAFFEPDGKRMRGDPFCSVFESKLNRAFVQSIATKLLANRCPVPLVPDRCTVVHVSPHLREAMAYNLPAWYTDNHSTVDAELYKALVADAQERQHTRVECLPQPEKPAPKKARPRKRQRTADAVV